MNPLTRQRPNSLPLDGGGLGWGWMQDSYLPAINFCQKHFTPILSFPHQSGRDFKLQSVRA
jgi:hypothetical protein